MLDSDSFDDSYVDTAAYYHRDKLASLAQIGESGAFPRMAANHVAAIHTALNAPSSSAHAVTQECQTAIDSVRLSRSNSSSRPAIWEYRRLRILNHLLRSRSCRGRACAWPRCPPSPAC